MYYTVDIHYVLYEFKMLTKQIELIPLLLTEKSLHANTRTRCTFYPIHDINHCQGNFSCSVLAAVILLITPRCPTRRFGTCVDLNAVDGKNSSWTSVGHGLITPSFLTSHTLSVMSYNLFVGRVALMTARRQKESRKNRISIEEKTNIVIRWKCFSHK